MSLAANTALKGSGAPTIADQLSRELTAAIEREVAVEDGQAIVAEPPFTLERFDRFAPIDRLRDVTGAAHENEPTVLPPEQKFHRLAHTVTIVEEDAVALSPPADHAVEQHDGNALALEQANLSLGLEAHRIEDDAVDPLVDQGPDILALLGGVAACVAEEQAVARIAQRLFRSADQLGMKRVSHVGDDEPN